MFLSDTTKNDLPVSSYKKEESLSKVKSFYTYKPLKEWKDKTFYTEFSHHSVCHLKTGG